MTDTIRRGAANQAGARIDTSAYDKAADFLPLKGIDHIEFWVGNARQAAAYYRALWGFTPVAYAGLETGVRDRASYVMRRNDITFVVTDNFNAGVQAGKQMVQALVNKGKVLVVRGANGSVAGDNRVDLPIRLR